MIYKYQKILSECKDTFEAEAKMKKFMKDDKYYAKAYYNIFRILHENYFTKGLKNPLKVLDVIIDNYVMTFNEYTDKMYDLFSSSCGNEIEIINQYIDYVAIFEDDEDMINLLPDHKVEDTLIFNEFYFDNDWGYYVDEETEHEIKTLFKYAIGDNNDL